MGAFACARLAVFLSFLTVPVMNIDLNVPIRAIEQRHSA